MIGKFMTYVWDRCEVVSRAIAIIPYIVYATVGLVIIGGSVAAALYIPLQIASVIVASIGSILGSAICSMTLAKYISESSARAVAVRDAEIRTLADAKAKVEAQAEENKKMEAKNRSLHEEITRLKLMHVKTEEFSPVLRLGLLECSATLHDISRSTILDKPSTTTAQAEKVEYLGIMEADFRGTLGVNLDELRFRDEGESTIVISGIRPVYQGFTHVKHREILTEIRVSKTKGTLRPDSHEFFREDSRLKNLALNQVHSIQDRINDGIGLKHTEAGVQKMAKEFLRLLFARIGKQVLFADSEDDRGLPLIDYLNGHNRAIDAKLRALELDMRVGSQVGSGMREIREISLCRNLGMMETRQGQGASGG